MEISIVRTVKVQVKSLKVEADVRYWEDATVNGIGDDDGSLIPCRVDDAWCPVIDLETGVIAGWPENTIASIHYKVCDAGRYALLDESGQEVAVKDGYVPAIMSPGGSGCGDYIIMNVGPTGIIENWDNRNSEEFEGAHIMTTNPSQTVSSGDDHLIPCPFCGSDPYWTEWEHGNAPMWCAQVKCNCGVEGDVCQADNRLGHFEAENGEHRAAAIAAWNTRAIPPELAQLREQVAVMRNGMSNCDQIILDHRIEGPYFQYRQTPSWAASCKCGHTVFGNSAGEVSRDWAIHVAAALALAFGVEEFCEDMGGINSPPDPSWPRP